jgi:Domain of unknown function (DUF5666)
MFNVLRFLRLLVPTVVVFVAVLACGGEGGVSEGGSGSEMPSVAIGTVESVSAESVALTQNARAYNTKSARVVDGFGEPLPAADLQQGMWVEVNGAEASTPTGTEIIADSVRLRPAARGVVTNSRLLTVMGSRVVTYQSTVVKPSANVPPNVGDIIEVHGRLKANGSIIASRVEVLANIGAKPFELRGRITAVDLAAQTATVGNQPVSYAFANVKLAGGAPSLGALVRVSAPAGPVDSQAWPVARLISDQVLPTAGVAIFYAQGVTKDFAAGTAGAGPTFTLEGLTVDATNAAVAAEVTEDGVCVVVFGELNASGTLVAKTVQVVNLGTLTSYPE